MIHNLLLRLSERLPLYPPAVVVVGAALVIVLALWLVGRSRQTVLFSLAVAILGLGLAVGLFGLNQPVEPANWKALEDIAERFIGPASFRRWEQLTAAGLALAAALLALVYNLVTQERPGERVRQRLEQDRSQSNALGAGPSRAGSGARRGNRWATASA